MVAMLAEVRPPKMRPIANHQRLGAKAINTKSMASPAVEIKIIGRRPKRSEREPSIGEANSCIKAQMAIKRPLTN